MNSLIGTLPVEDLSTQTPERVVFVAQSNKPDEGAANVHLLPVSCSLAPPSLIEDDSRTLDEGGDNPEQQADMHSLCSEHHKSPLGTSTDAPLDYLKLSTYEYAALEERYRTLSRQHCELRKLTLAYDDVIHGSSPHEDPTASAEELRAEAGYEGLRAKAREADVLSPIIREAGGLQALISQAKSVQPLIEQAGGLHELKKMVAEAHMLRLRAKDVGGSQSSDYLVSQANTVRSEQWKHAEPRANVVDPNELRAKALKYDMLQQAFTAIEKGHTIDRRQGGHVSGKTASMEATKSTVPDGRRAAVSEPIMAMNPDRARLLTTAPSARDRELYEPRPLKRKASTKTGSNDVPLGPSRAGRRSIDQVRVNAPKKRHHEIKTQANLMKRPRVDIGRSSALVQATLVPSSTHAASYKANQLRVAISRPVSTYRDENSEQLHYEEQEDEGRTQPIENIQEEVARLIETHAKVVEKARLTPVKGDGSSIDSLLRPVYDLYQPVVKTEEPSGKLHATLLIASPAIRDNKQGKAATMVGNYPIALWTGVSYPSSYNTSDLIKAEEIPSELANFLSTEIMKYVQNIDFKVWNSMPLNSDICVLQHLVDGRRPSNQPQEGRACRACSGACVRLHRPCASLQEIDGVRMVVFMPLRDALRRNVHWMKKGYWIPGV
jgi:hypothetical protein